MNTSTPRLQQLKKAIEISEKIEQLEQELKAVLEGTDSGSAAVAQAAAPGRPGRKPGVSQAQATTGAAAKRGRKPGRAKRIVSPEARAKMAEAQRRRWAKAKR